MDGFLDIIIFAAIAVALLWRLRGVLGERSEDEPKAFGKNIFSAQETNDAIEAQVKATLQSLPEPVIAQSPANWSSNLPNYDIVETATAHHSLVPFVTIDPGFSPDDFIAKARRAFTSIVAAFAKGDKKTIGFLLTPELAADFNAQIDQRFEKNETYVVHVNDVKKALITDADLDGTTAFVTVDFIAQQSITHKTAEGVVIAGEDGMPELNKDRWVFTKDLKSSDPKWLLGKTEDID